MKNLLLALMLLVCFAAKAETSWVIAHTAYNTATIYSIETYGGNTSVNTYHVENPTTTALQGIGLPSYLWSLLAENTGIFDTRLIQLTSEKLDLTNELNDLRVEKCKASDDAALKMLTLSVCLIISLFFAIYFAFSNRN